MRTPHGDNHDLWIAPNDANRMIASDDGGAHVSVDGGATWTKQDNQATAQFYHVIADDQFPYWVYGAQQDNSTVAIASRTSGAGIDRTDWYPVGGCESGYIAPKPGDPNIVYAGCYDGHVTRYDHRTKQERDVTVYPENPMGWGAEGMKFRFQWTAPIVISPHDPELVYSAGNVLFQSRNGGQSWEAISPDLTRNDKTKLGPSGGPITKDNTSVEYYGDHLRLRGEPAREGAALGRLRRRPRPRVPRRGEELDERHPEGPARSGAWSARSTPRPTTRARCTSRSTATSSTTIGLSPT